MIRILSGFPDNVVAVNGTGQISRQDYATILIPRVEAALAQHPSIRLYYEIDANFSGFDPGAAWEDFKVGMEHLLRWERIAVVTDISWIQHGIKAFGFLLPGKMRIFPLAQREAAQAWIVSA